MTDPARVVIEDPAVARLVLGALVRDTTMQLEGDRLRRRNGLPGRAVAPPRELLDALAAVADVPAPAVGSASGTDVATLDLSSTSWVTVQVAADQFGISEEYTRRLARAGRIRQQRVGRGWLIDIDSMKSYRDNRRTA